MKPTCFLYLKNSQNQLLKIIEFESLEGCAPKSNKARFIFSLTKSYNICVRLLCRSNLLKNLLIVENGKKIHQDTVLSARLLCRSLKKVLPPNLLKPLTVFFVCSRTWQQIFICPSFRGLLSSLLLFTCHVW